MISEIFSFLAAGVTNVIQWFMDLLTGIFGSYYPFGFFIAGIIVFTYALRILGVFSGVSLSDTVKKHYSNKDKEYKSSLREYSKSYQYPDNYDFGTGGYRR